MIHIECNIRNILMQNLLNELPIRWTNWKEIYFYIYDAQCEVGSTLYCVTMLFDTNYLEIIKWYVCHWSYFIIGTRFRHSYALHVECTFTCIGNAAIFVIEVGIGKVSPQMISSVPFLNIFRFKVMIFKQSHS